VDRPREPLPTVVDATPPLPATYHDALAAGLPQLSVELPVAALAAIEGHVRLLLAWTAAINLTAIRDPTAVATAHVLDSLTAVPWLTARASPSLLDLGSGGGFPGVPLAAALPDADVALLESVAKKARFLEASTTATQLAPRVRVISARAEAVARARDHREAWSVVTARAVATSAELVELAFPLLAPGGSLLAWKGAVVDDELAAARRAVAALGGGRIDIIPGPTRIPELHGHVILVATRSVTGRMPDAYPRDPSARTRRPW
jgi:16S rRNA (guanine527-N7)-methyltransferase